MNDNNSYSITLYTDEISEIIRPTMVFANGGYRNQVFHFIDFSYVELFSYLAVYIVLPILTSVIGNRLSELIKQRGGNKVKLGIEEGTMCITSGEKEFMDKDVITTKELAAIKAEQTDDDNLLVNSPIDKTRSEDAKKALAILFISNGWPKKVAKKNAEKIVDYIVSLEKK